jgi:hypothetical protein
MLRSSRIASAVVVSQVVFVLTIAFGAPCSERCPDDGPDGRCPPACVTCACSPRPATGPALLVVIPPAHIEVVPGVALLTPCEPDPADIAHVPKPLLA